MTHTGAAQMLEAGGERLLRAHTIISLAGRFCLPHDFTG